MDTSKETNLEDVYHCIEWIRSLSKLAAGGRNFSVVSDPWNKNEGKKLANSLLSDSNMFTLRRTEQTHESI
jgi:hypothetical protein